MFGSLHRPVCFLIYFFVIISARMSVNVTSPEAVWALRPRGKLPPCPPELRERLVSLDLWTPTPLIHTTTGWRPVPHRGCRAGRRVRKQPVTSLSVSTSPSSREWQIPVIVGRRVSAEQQSAASDIGHRQTPATGRHRHTLPARQSVLRTVPLCRRVGQQANTDASDVTRRLAPCSNPAPSVYVLNAAALTKPHAVKHLAADLHSYNVHITVITETHLKSKHIDNVVAVPGYTLLR